MKWARRLKMAQNLLQLMRVYLDASFEQQCPPKRFFTRLLAVVATAPCCHWKVRLTLDPKKGCKTLTEQMQLSNQDVRLQPSLACLMP